MITAVSVLNQQQTRDLESYQNGWRVEDSSVLETKEVKFRAEMSRMLFVRSLNSTREPKLAKKFGEKLKLSSSRVPSYEKISQVSS